MQTQRHLYQHMSYSMVCGTAKGKEQTMKLLVDELPLYKDDCMFAEPKWLKDERWVTYCRFTNERCDLGLNERECSFLKEQDD